MYLYCDNYNDIKCFEDMWSGDSGDHLSCMQKLQLGVSSFSCKGHAWSKWMSSDSLSFPVLELFYFRRIIFDELHELVGNCTLKWLRAEHFWGLTATPLISSCRHVSFMAELLHVDVAGPGSHALSDKDLVLRENCSRFLDACVRQNSAEIPKIRLVQHLRLVRHTPQERALYLSASADLWTDSLQKNRQLLILCSHFSDLGEKSANEAGRPLYGSHIKYTPKTNIDGILIMYHVMPKSIL